MQTKGQCWWTTMLEPPKCNCTDYFCQCRRPFSIPRQHNQAKTILRIQHRPATQSRELISYLYFWEQLATSQSYTHSSWLSISTPTISLVTITKGWMVMKRATLRQAITAINYVIIIFPKRNLKYRNPDTGITNVQVDSFTTTQARLLTPCWLSKQLLHKRILWFPMQNPTTTKSSLFFHNYYTRSKQKFENTNTIDYDQQYCTATSVFQPLIKCRCQLSSFLTGAFDGDYNDQDDAPLL